MAMLNATDKAILKDNGWIVAEDNKSAVYQNRDFKVEVASDKFVVLAFGGSIQIGELENVNEVIEFVKTISSLIG